ncbi:uncharacterized protein C24B11.05 [Medicago truncatula]|uniref:uncharacterized protein C24B11.05 n=1 Tax=Medicago truncatula TaxID=3880 RepID=UPI00196836DE|nr:uncharacterized protein C24B11.05 [Medicago truncatula]
MEFVNLFTQKPKYDCLLFDLDDTLYPLSSGLAEACRQNFKDYMEEMLCIDPRKSDNLCTLLYKNYGTTLAGLKAIGYDFDYDELHSFVHGRLPYVNLKPDPVLRKMLMSLPYRKLIFTNADKVHALKTLNILGLEDCFEGIICFETLNPIHRSSVSTNPSGILPKSPIVCKPSENAIQLALKIANLDPHRTLFFEDSVRNIQAGKRVGLDTVLIGTSQKVQGADYALESIHNLPEAIPDLWEADLKSEVVYTGKLAVETTVTA